MHRIHWTLILLAVSALTLVACGGADSSTAPDTSSGAADAGGSMDAAAPDQDAPASSGDAPSGDEDAPAPTDDVAPVQHDVEAPDEDWDDDGLTNLQEAIIGSNPLNADTDGDGLSDSEEFAAGSSVLAVDSDVDGLDDAAEVAAGTNPTRADSDGDGFSDSTELDAATDPLDRRSWPFGGTTWPDMTPFGETSYPSGWSLGDTLPPVPLIDQFDAALDLARFHGYVVLLDFSAGWCMPCREAAETAEALWTTYRDQGFMIVHLLTEGNQPGVSTTLGLQNEWRIQYGLNFPVVREVDSGVIYTTFAEKSGFYTGSLPFLVLLDRDMVIDSGYGAGQEVAIEARIQELLGAEMPTLPGATSHPIPAEAALICDADGDDHNHGSCGGSDCDDTNGAIQPDTEEVCDLVDHNCDGWLHLNAVDTSTFYADEDRDGYGDPMYTVGYCELMWPYVQNGEDCDDTNPALNPETMWYFDMDGDGLGNPDESLQVCDPPEGYVANDQDTDDDDGTSLGCWTHITVGRDHSCGLKSDGSIACWGCNVNGQHNAPEGSFVAIDSGMTHTCALDAAGAITCWGSNTGGSLNAPDEIFSSFACGLNFCCGITTQATNNIRCWGSNDFEQSTPPEGLFTQVSVGDSRHACAVNAAGEMTCWGYDYGQVGATNPLTAPAGVYGEARVGHKFTMAFLADGTAVGWGADTSGQASPPDASFVDIRGGIVHSCGLRDDGSLICWGSNSLGRTDSPEGDSYTQIDVGQFHSCALANDGLGTCWGSGTCHEDFCPGNPNCDKMVVPACGG